MSQTTNVLFPLVLDILSHKPQLSETQNNLVKALSQKLKSKGIKLQGLKKELEATIDVAKGLGILTVQDEEIRMPFGLKFPKGFSWSRSGSNKTEKAAPSRSKSAPGMSKNKAKPELKTAAKPTKRAEETEKLNRSPSRTRKRSRSRIQGRSKGKSRSRSQRRSGNRGRSPISKRSR